MLHGTLALLDFHACARTLAFCPQLPFFHCITSSRASKGPLGCRRWTFEASPITCQFVGYADIRQPLRATVHTHMFYPRPLQQKVPQYIGLDVHLTCMRFRPVHVDVKSCAAALRPLCLHPKLPAKLAFVPYQELDAEGIDCNGRRLRKEGETFLIDMQAFVEERLHPVKLSAARKKERKEDITEEERSSARSTCGALNWAGREGRPDAAAAASMFSSLMSSMRVEDVIDLNRVVEQLKADSKVALRIQPIQESRLHWGVISDASWANAKNGKTQAGHMLIAFDKALLEGAKATTNLLHSRSGKLQRMVNSTLAAERRSLARGVWDLLWMMVVYM